MSEVPCPFKVIYRFIREGKNEIYLITWSFQGFKELLNTTTVHEFRTPIVVNEPASKFQLKMLLWGKHNDWIEIYYVSPTSMVLKTDTSLFTVSSDQRKEIIKFASDLKKINANQWQFIMKFGKMKIDDELIFQLKLALAYAGDARMNDTPSGSTALQLFEDLTNLLTDETYSDVTLKSVEGEEIRAHKNLLVTRSKVLKAHFEHNTTEAVTNVIETPFEYEVLRDVLAYIYTSKAPHIEDFPEKLLAAADYYQLNALKRLCEETMQRRLTVENAIETLQLAELHSANSLTQYTLEFIKPQVHMITKSEGWANLQSIELVKAILEYVHSPA